MSKDITILKRDGSREQLDLEKMHKVVFYAFDDVAGGSASQEEL